MVAGFGDGIATAANGILSRKVIAVAVMVTVVAVVVVVVVVVAVVEVGM